MSISVKQLASLANDRTLSPVFEQAWYDRTGVNPVLCALKIAKFKEEKFRYKTILFLAGVAFVGSVLAMVALFMHMSPAETTTITLAGIFDGVAIGMLLVIALVSLIFILFPCVSTEEINYDALTIFCDDLVIFFRNEPIDKWGCTARSNLEQLREHAFKILTEKAMTVLMAKRRMDPTEEEQKNVDAVVQHGQRLTELSITYDALNRIGMASGGFGPAYKAAKKQMGEAEIKAV